MSSPNATPHDRSHENEPAPDNPLEDALWAALSASRPSHGSPSSLSSSSVSLRFTGTGASITRGRRSGIMRIKWRSNGSAPSSHGRVLP